MIKVFAFLLTTTAFADIIIASGSRLGVYHTIAMEECKQMQIPCKVIETSGSLANIKLLQAGKVDYAIIQDNLGTKNMVIVKQFPTKEHLHIFYKGNIKNFAQLMEGNYTVDIGSGTYATLWALQEVFNFKLKKVYRDIQKKQLEGSFCDRQTQVSFYNIAENSLPYQQMMLDNLRCNVKEYKFTKEEEEILRQTIPHLKIKDGLIENNIILVRKS